MNIAAPKLYQIVDVFPIGEGGVARGMFVYGGSQKASKIDSIDFKTGCNLHINIDL